jgi:hypothetical protein
MNSTKSNPNMNFAIHQHVLSFASALKQIKIELSASSIFFISHGTNDLLLKGTLTRDF